MRRPWPTDNPCVDARRMRALPSSLVAFALVACAPVAPAREAISRTAPTSACAFPSVVSVTNGTSGCSGTLLAPDLVLYAAHCGTDMLWAYPGPFRDRALRVPIAHCEEHPLYRRGALSELGHDFAICTLMTPIDAPIVPIASACEVASLRTTAAPVVFVGYGLTETGMDGTKRAATGTARIHDGSSGFGTYDMVTVTSDTDGVGVCPGDSGGPDFMRLGDGTFRLLSVHSVTGSECNASGGRAHESPPAYAALAWIESSTGRDVTPCRNASGAWDGSACPAIPSDPGFGEGAWGSCTWSGTSTLVETCTTPSEDAAVVMEDAAIPVADAWSMLDAAGNDVGTSMRDAGTAHDASVRDAGLPRLEPSCGCRISTSHPRAGIGMFTALVALAFVRRLKARLAA